ncbi:MAG: hypothetical protein ACK4ON_14790, partial [Bacteroidia bacterium]
MEKPEIFLICEEEQDGELVKAETNYPFLRIILHKAGSSVRGFLKRRRMNGFFASLDMIFPYPFRDDNYFKLIPRKIFWIGDFQEKYLPEFFSEEALKNRESINQKIATQQAEVVFSSNSAMQDFDTFYPNHNCKKFLLQFAVTHPDFSDLSAEEVLSKYGIRSPYIISPNQFWVHKNHRLILDAVKMAL